ncbi:MAG TPA: hypothetical protein VN033_07260 [Vulgatibacter sp.]|nr:hypothetical protein [Vulgatibacter sp.]
MHAFVYRIVERLTGDGPALSRNRHFHAFTSPEGRQALRVARRLRSIARDAAASGAPLRFVEASDGAGEVHLEIPIPAGVRRAILPTAEWDLLRRMPAMRAVSLERADPRGHGMDRAVV